MTTGTSSGAYLGFEFVSGAWQISPFDTKDNAYSICTFISKSLSVQMPCVCVYVNIKDILGVSAKSKQFWKIGTHILTLDKL